MMFLLQLVRCVLFGGPCNLHYCNFFLFSSLQYVACQQWTGFRRNFEFPFWKIELGLYVGQLFMGKVEIEQIVLVMVYF